MNYVDSSARPPPADAVKATLAQYVSNAKLANCTYASDVVCSIAGSVAAARAPLSGARW